MRLDAFLVDMGLSASRGRAKRAITEGRVKVDGITVTKPSKQVGYDSNIEVTGGIDVPAGYLKLKDIQEQTNIIHPGDTVLDLGSSAGGFIMFASGIAADVRGIEYSTEFMPRLEEMAESIDNVTVINGDVFSIPLDSLSECPVDVILNDITVEPDDSLMVLERVLPLLKPKGRILQVLKLTDRSGLDALIGSIEGMGLAVRHIIEPEKREVYVIAVRNGQGE